MACCLSMGTTMLYSRGSNFNGASASVSFLAGSKNTRTSVSLNVKNKAQINPRKALLVSAFTPTCSSLSLSSASSFSGSSLGLDFSSSATTGTQKRRSFVVRAKKYSLCQTKRNRSRKSLARVHGFRKRMSTTSGRAVISRRRAKGRWVLCTKSNPISGKGA